MVCFFSLQEMLNKSRKDDSGVKLEVNEKILDACTGLMAAVRQLVITSRKLQAEIVAQGKVLLQNLLKYAFTLFFFFYITGYCIC
jgi:hypothetical protein